MLCAYLSPSVSVEQLVCPWYLPNNERTVIHCRLFKKKKKLFKETKMAKNVYPSPQIDSESSEYSYDDVMVRGRSETETKPILSVREFT